MALHRVSDWLGGVGVTSRAAAVLRMRLVLTVSLLVANLTGALVVAGLSVFVLPGPSVLHGRTALITYVALPGYVALALVVGAWLGTRRALRALEWFNLGREPDTADAAATFAVPRKLTVLQAQLWAGGVVFLTALYGSADGANTPRAAFSIAFGGLVVCANAFLLSELGLRPAAAVALRVGAPRRRAGIQGRLVLAWALGSAIPVAGLMLVATYTLVRIDVTARRLAVTELVLGGVTLTFGFLLINLMGGLTVGPIRSVRLAMAAVGAGTMSTTVEVYDGTELGELQTGFNAMAAGLRDRERLHDLFGRHVGRAVATAALAHLPELGGEERYVAALFVDIVGSTAMAQERRPAAVVDVLNRFLTVVVEEVERGGGLLNKFVGDAALAVFGAPTVLPDPAGAALATARRVVDRLAHDVPEIAVGAGVAAGIAIAGNIGAAERFEFTVIGDPVNEAARLSDVAKTEPGCLLASDRAVAAAAAAEAQHWTYVRDETLRGRRAATGLHRPSAEVV